MQRTGLVAMQPYQANSSWQYVCAGKNVAASFDDKSAQDYLACMQPCRPEV